MDQINKKIGKPENFSTVQLFKTEVMRANVNSLNIENLKKTIPCKIYLKHIVEQVHGGTAHVNGDWVEEEDGVVLGHTDQCRSLNQY